MLTLIALVSTTRFADLLAGLHRLAVPRLLIIQLGFLYRYIFLLIDNAQHILRARAGRAIGKIDFRTGTKYAAAMLGSLFVRSVDTAERVNTAMQARGFNGDWRTINRLAIRGRDWFFMAYSACFIFGLYFLVKPVLQ
jgi:cobalt/nickel transport system permease protein